MCVRDVIVDCANVHECGCMWQQVRASARCVTVLGVKSRHYLGHYTQTNRQTFNLIKEKSGSLSNVPIADWNVLLARALEALVRTPSRHMSRQHTHSTPSRHMTRQHSPSPRATLRIEQLRSILRVRHTVDGKVDGEDCLDTTEGARAGRRPKRI